jgi:hypothetical protein
MLIYFLKILNNVTSYTVLDALTPNYYYKIYILFILDELEKIILPTK